MRREVLTPRLFFNRGRRHLRRELGRLVRQISGGTDPHRNGNGHPARLASPSARQIDRALDVAMETLAQFRRRLSERGREVLAALPADALAFVVLGRPYTLHDAAVNMHIGKKIQDLGILAIPDMLPGGGRQWPTTWNLIYARRSRTAWPPPASSARIPACARWCSPTSAAARTRSPTSSCATS